MQTGNKHEDMKTEIMKTVFKQFRGSENSENTITGLSEKAEGILTKAVEMWPIIQRPFMKDQIEDVSEKEGGRASNLGDVLGEMKAYL